MFKLRTILRKWWWGNLFFRLCGYAVQNISGYVLLDVFYEFYILKWPFLILHSHLFRLSTSSSFSLYCVFESVKTLKHGQNTSVSAWKVSFNFRISFRLHCIPLGLFSSCCLWKVMIYNRGTLYIIWALCHEIDCIATVKWNPFLSECHLFS